MKAGLETYEADQPWIVYRYLSTDRETRFTGRSRIQCVCAVCGVKKTLRIKIPRFGAVPAPEGGKHIERLRFLQAHLHRGEARHPMSWVMPLLNPAAHVGGIDLDLLAIRLEADLTAAEETSR